MAVQLLPFQKLVDIPDVAHRHRRAIRGLAIASVVIISLIACLFMAYSIPYYSWQTWLQRSLSVIIGIPFMIMLCVLVCTSNILSLRNTDTWEANDKCCNLMRSQPACCTKSCGSKHCCARLSRVHMAVSVLASVFFAFFFFLVVLACNASRYTYSYDSTGQYNRQETYAALPIVLVFNIPILVLIISLVGTSARSAWLLRAIENAQPDITLLPEGKMVTQAVDRNILQTVVVGDAVAGGDGHPNDDDSQLETEQVTVQNV